MISFLCNGYGLQVTGYRNFAAEGVVGDAVAEDVDVAIYHQFHTLFYSFCLRESVFEGGDGVVCIEVRDDARRSKGRLTH